MKTFLQVVLKFQQQKKNTQNHSILPTKYLLAVCFELLLSITYRDHLYPLLPPFLHTQTYWWVTVATTRAQKMNDTLYLVRWQRSFPRLQGDTPATFPQDSPLTSLLRPPSILRMAERGKKINKSPTKQKLFHIVLIYALNSSVCERFGSCLQH